MCRWLALYGLLGSPAAGAATYHVDALRGDDGRSGRSAAMAWRTLGKVNGERFLPGDRILFKSGCRWVGQLVIRSSGTPEAPVVIGRYGSGSLPRIDGDGQVEQTVLLRNVEGVELRDLEITNRGSGEAMRRGVYVFLDDFGTARHVTVAGLYVHDVNGTNKAKDSGGIVFRVQGEKKLTRFDGLLVERNIVWKADRTGILLHSYYWPRNRWNPSVNVVIRDNLVEDIGGDGIVPWATSGVVVEHNIARDCNRRANSFNAAIWPWSADDALIQLNEASFTRTTRDGQGFDSDYNARNTLFQYNYSHDNEGGFMLICNPDENRPHWNVGNIGTTVRYNISRNDRERIFELSAVEQTTVHDNAIYVGAGIDVQMLILSNWSGWAKDAMFRNNRFYVEGTASYGHEMSRDADGRYLLAPGFGPATGIVFSGNLYAGEHRYRPADAGAIVETVAKPPAIDWDGPRFDPARPEGFGGFLKEHRNWMLRLFEKQFGEAPRLGR